MAGIDRSRIVGRDEEEIYDYTCYICHELFTDPMVTPCCQSVYCRECIEQWLTTSNTCPNDRKPLTSNVLSKAPRAFVNQMNNMRIKCRLSDKGCPSVHKICQDEEHMKVCEFVTCKKCGFNEPDVSHDCLTYLLEVKLNLSEDIDKLKTENEELIEVNLNLNQTNDNLKTDIEDLRNANRDLKTDLDMSKEEVITLTQKFVDLQREYEIFESELKTEIADLMKANRDLNATQSEIKEVNNGLETEILDLKKRAEDLLSSDSENKEKNQKLITDLKLMSNDLARAKDMQLAYESQVKSLNNQIIKLKSEWNANLKANQELKITNKDRMKITEWKKELNHYKKLTLPLLIREAKPMNGTVEQNQNISQYWENITIGICQDVIKSFDNTKHTHHDFINCIKNKMTISSREVKPFIDWSVDVALTGELMKSKDNFIKLSFGLLIIIISTNFYV